MTRDLIKVDVCYNCRRNELAFTLTPLSIEEALGTMKRCGTSEAFASHKIV